MQNNSWKCFHDILQVLSRYFLFFRPSENKKRSNYNALVLGRDALEKMCL